MLKITRETAWRAFWSNEFFGVESGMGGVVPARLSVNDVARLVLSRGRSNPMAPFGPAPELPSVSAMSSRADRRACG